MPVSPVTHRQEIAAPAPAVWELISTAGHLVECHPFCAANPVDVWPGIGSEDHIEYFNGRTITRRFVGWQEGAGYDIEITDANGTVATVDWRLSGEGAGSALTIAISRLTCSETCPRCCDGCRTEHWCAPCLLAISVPW